MKINDEWTLFLDRDGVINEKLTGYVRQWDEFQFAAGSLIAIRHFARLFGRILVVTNQQGIGKGLMSEENLKSVHDSMRSEIEANGGRLDAIYHCSHLADEGCLCRKPGVAMPQQAKLAFPEIDFSRSIMVGDSYIDMMMGRQLGMRTVLIKHPDDDSIKEEFYDYRFEYLLSFAEWLVGFQH